MSKSKNKGGGGGNNNAQKEAEARERARQQAEANDRARKAAEAAAAAAQRARQEAEKREKDRKEAESKVKAQKDAENRARAQKEAADRERSRKEAESKEAARKLAEAASAKKAAEDKAKNNNNKSNNNDKKDSPKPSSGNKPDSNQKAQDFLKQAVKEVGNKVSASEVKDLVNKGYSAADVQKVASKANKVTGGAEAIINKYSQTSSQPSSKQGQDAMGKEKAKGAVKAAAKAAGSTLTKSEVKNLKNEGLSTKQIQKVAGKVDSVGSGAANLINKIASGGSGGRGGGNSGAGGGFSGGEGEFSGGSGSSGGGSSGNLMPNNYVNEFNPAAASTTYGFSGDAMRLGMSGDFAKGLILPGKNAQLTAAEQEDVRRNIENQFKLYADQQLTSLRGRISKELAQLYNMTEIGKSKIAAQSAMDTTRETGMQTFRQNVRDNYGRSLMSMW
jgi:hypothetical protein